MAFTLSALFHLGLAALLAASMASAEQATHRAGKPLTLSLSAFVRKPARTDQLPHKKPEKPAGKPVEKTAGKSDRKPRPHKNPKQPATAANQPVATSSAATGITKARPAAPAPGLWAEYKKALRAAIEKRQRYPLQSRRRREQGTVIVRFVLHRDGRISDIRIDKSSGYARLDNAAIDAVRNIGIFRSFPDGIKAQNRVLTLPVSYSLGQRSR